jgi:hypothetical protein
MASRLLTERVRRASLLSKVVHVDETVKCALAAAIHSARARERSASGVGWLALTRGARCARPAGCSRTGSGSGGRVSPASAVSFCPAPRARRTPCRRPYADRRPARCVRLTDPKEVPIRLAQHVRDNDLKVRPPATPPRAAMHGRYSASASRRVPLRGIFPGAEDGAHAFRRARRRRSANFRKTANARAAALARAGQNAIRPVLRRFGRARVRGRLVPAGHGLAPLAAPG